MSQLGRHADGDHRPGGDAVIIMIVWPELIFGGEGITPEKVSSSKQWGAPTDKKEVKLLIQTHPQMLRDPSADEVPLRYNDPAQENYPHTYDGPDSVAVTIVQEDIKEEEEGEIWERRVIVKKKDSGQECTKVLIEDRNTPHSVIGRTANKLMGRCKQQTKMPVWNPPLEKTRNSDAEMLGCIAIRSTSDGR